MKTNSHTFKTKSHTLKTKIHTLKTKSHAIKTKIHFSKKPFHSTVRKKILHSENRFSHRGLKEAMTRFAHQLFEECLSK